MIHMYPDLELSVGSSSLQHAVDIAHGPQEAGPDNVGSLVGHVVGQVKGQLDVQQSGPGQVEGIVHELGPVDDVDGLVIGTQLFGNQLPVLAVIVHSIVAFKETKLEPHHHE